MNLSGSTGPHNVRDVLARLLRALGVPGGTLSGDVDELTELYRNRTAGRRVLLVLEGVAREEQVLLPLRGEEQAIEIQVGVTVLLVDENGRRG